MIYSTRYHYHVSWYYFNTNPLIILITYIKISWTLHYKSYFFISVQVFSKKILQFFFIIWKTFFGTNYFIFISVTTFLLELRQDSVSCKCFWIELKYLLIRLAGEYKYLPSVTLKYSTPVILCKSSNDKNSGGFRWCSNLWSPRSLSIYQARTIFNLTNKWKQVNATGNYYQELLFSRIVISSFNMIRIKVTKNLNNQNTTIIKK